MGGGGSSKTTIIWYSYEVTIGVAVSMGPIDKFVRFDYNCDYTTYNAYRSGDYLNLYTSESVKYSRFWWGTNTQTPDPLLSGLHEGMYYRNVAYTSLRVDLGAQPSMPATAFYVCRWYRPDALSTVTAQTSSYGLNPAILIYDLLTNQHYGFGLSAEVVDTDSFITVGNILTEEDVGYSTVIQGGELYNTLRAVLDWIDGELIYDEDTAKVALKLRRYDYDVSGLVTVTESDMRANTFEFNRPSWYATKNCVYVNFFDINRECDQNAVYAEDLGNYNMTNNIRVQEFNFECFTTESMAQKVAMRLLHRQTYPYAKVTFECFANKGDLLDIYDPFVLVHSYYGVNGVYRCTERRKQGPNLWKIEAIEDSIMPAGATMAIGFQPDDVPFLVYGNFLPVTDWGYRILESYYRGSLVLGYTDDQITETSLDRFRVDTGVSVRYVDYACIGRLKGGITISIGGDATVEIYKDRHFKTALQNVHYLLIDDEIMKVSSYTETTSTATFNCPHANRAKEGTVEATHGGGAKVFMIECKSISSDSLLPGATYTLEIFPHYMYPKPTYDVNGSKTTNIFVQGLLYEPMEPTGLTASSSNYLDDITFSWTKQNREGPAPPVCTGLTPYPQYTTGSSGYEDQIIGWKIMHTTIAGTSSLLTVTIDESARSYTSTYAARCAAGLSTGFKFWVAARGINGYDSPAATQVIYAI